MASPTVAGPTSAASPAVASPTGAAIPAAAGPTPCAPLSGPSAPPPPKPTTITTLRQAYECLFANYYGGPLLDDRALLVGAFSALTQELEGRGLDQANATLPALTGDRQGDWAAFARTYQAVLAALPDDAPSRQALASAAMNGMVSSLDDNHVSWTYPPAPGATPRGTYGLGFETSPESGLVRRRPQAALPPLFVAEVDPNGPAARQDVRLGDVIEAVNGSSPFPDGVVSVGVMNWLHPQYPQADPVRLTLHRPATGRTWDVTLTPTVYQASPSTVSAKVLGGDVAYARLPEFAPGAADQVLRAIGDLHRGTPSLRAVILDLRLNPGGGVPEVAKLLGAFAHGQTWEYDCDTSGHCDEQRTDDTVPLLHLQLVVLTDRNCASACARSAAR
ncbi:MAG TPA: S41 family peptidase [Thermomicrobiales bacterium]|nr:S41 family peptidase [Thermomicrobiales bacterium]